MKNIEVLQISNNSNTKVPSEILRSNTKLRILDMSINRLPSVDLGINGHAPPELLDLSYTRLFLWTLLVVKC